MANMKYRIIVYYEDGRSFFVYANSFDDVSSLVSCIEGYKIDSIDISKVEDESQGDIARKEAGNATD